MILHTQDEIQFELPFLPPSTNQMYRAYRGRVVKSVVLKQFQQSVLQFFAESDQDITMLEGSLEATIHFQLRGRNIDIDNLLKSLFDSLEGILFKNDSAIFKVTCDKELRCAENKTIVHLKKIIPLTPQE